jgi:hypothetical protein
MQQTNQKILTELAQLRRENQTMRDTLKAQLGLDVGAKGTTQLDVFQNVHLKLTAAIAAARAAVVARKNLQAYAVANNATDLLDLLVNKLPTEEQLLLSEDAAATREMLINKLSEETLLENKETIVSKFVNIQSPSATPPATPTSTLTIVEEEEDASKLPTTQLGKRKKTEKPAAAPKKKKAKKVSIDTPFRPNIFRFRTSLKATNWLPRAQGQRSELLWY